MLTRGVVITKADVLNKYHREEYKTHFISRTRTFLILRSSKLLKRSLCFTVLEKVSAAKVPGLLSLPLLPYDNRDRSTFRSSSEDDTICIRRN